jgi:hypothetical protein
VIFGRTAREYTTSPSSGLFETKGDYDCNLIIALDTERGDELIERLYVELVRVQETAGMLIQSSPPNLHA